MAASLLKHNEALKTDLTHYKAIGFGSGIYFGSHHPAIVEVVKNLDQSDQEVFIFSSQALRFWENIHEPIKRLLVEKGKKIAGEFSVRGYDETGPWVIIGGGNVGKPDEKDLKKAAKFLRNCLSQYCMPDFMSRLKKLPVKEGFVNTYELKVNYKMIALNGDLLQLIKQPVWVVDDV